MDKIVMAAAIFCMLTAVGVVLYDYRKTKKTFSRIGHMLDDAMENRFSEKIFDESRLSALETRFANYLSASAISAQNVKIERDNIKSLISDISHQTKTPIANLLLYSELLSEGGLSEEMKHNVDAIWRQAESLRFLIDSLVKLSRLENGIFSLSPRPETVRPMLQSIYGQFSPKAEEKGLKLCLEDTEAVAVFDPKWTAEAIGNIVDNAIKYTVSGSVSLSVVCYEFFLRIDIADSGIGIAESELSRIFKRFYRSESVKDQEGVGIGLYLAREIITGEGGYIKVSSVVGSGSTFSVFLPR